MTQVDTYEPVLSEADLERLRSEPYPSLLRLAVPMKEGGARLEGELAAFHRRRGTRLPKRKYR